MGVPDSFGTEVRGDPVPLSLGDGPDRTHCGIGLGHAGSGWKTGAFGLREAKGLSSGWLSLPWWSLSYDIKSIPHNKRQQNTYHSFDRDCFGLINLHNRINGNDRRPNYGWRINRS